MSRLPNNPTNGGVPNSSSRSLRERVRQAAKQVESEIIIDALQHHRWNRRRAAEALNISYRSLMYKMKSCNLRDAAGVGLAPDETSANRGD